MLPNGVKDWRIQTFPPPVLAGSGSTGTLMHLSQSWLPEVSFDYALLRRKAIPMVFILSEGSYQY
tara:strand:+ start:9176 stop:9370 length:195 start_codon:yes stop_codon:yes gene_type:complete